MILQQLFTVTLLAMSIQTFASEIPSTFVAPITEEVHILQKINELRTDYPHASISMLESVKRLDPPFGQWKAGDSSIPAKGSPLVFSAILNTVARHLLTAGTTAIDRQLYDAKEVSGKFGYPSSEQGAVALFARGNPSLDATFGLLCIGIVGEVIDSDNPANSHPRFAGHEACQAAWREVGIALALNATDKTWSVIMVLGKGSSPHLAGGVCYVDVNHNGRGDIGEGKAGILVTMKDAAMTTGPGGAWWATPASADPSTVTFELDGLIGVRPLDTTLANQTVDWQVPILAEIQELDSLVASAQKTQKNPDVEKQKPVLAALLVKSRSTALDDARLSRIRDLVTPIQGDFDSTLSKIMDAIHDDSDETLKIIANQKKRWNGAIPGWFKAAEKLAITQRQVRMLQAIPLDQQEKTSIAALTSVRKAIAATSEPEFVRQYEGLVEALMRIVPETVESPKKKK